MNVPKETTAPNKVKLTIELSSEEFEAGMAAAYKKIVKQINIPGFRKGKAPRKVIENFYGESVFYEVAFKYAFPKAYDKAIDEQDLFPVEQPQIDIVSIGTQEKTVFTAEFFVKPEVTLGQYKGIEVEKKNILLPPSRLTPKLSRPAAAMPAGKTWIAPAPWATAQPSIMPAPSTALPLRAAPAKISRWSLVPAPSSPALKNRSPAWKRVRSATSRSPSPRITARKTWRAKKPFSM
jgi:hypothetical protein